MNPASLRFASEPLGAPGAQGPVTVTWLGTAGFAVTHGAHTILIDPYVTRASIAHCALGPLAPDIARVHTYTPRADAIIVGHTHFDHALDVPAIARHTGARVFGSRSAVALCRLDGLPESQVEDVERAPGSQPETREIGPFTLRFHASAHSKFLFGTTPFVGEITDCESVPLRMEGYRCGAVFGVEIRVAGRTLFHLGSGEVLDEALDVKHLDLLFMCVAGWASSRNFPERAMRALSPRAVLFSHWDNYFAPFERGARLLPAIKMPQLVERLGRASRDTRLGTLPFFGSVTI